jgi:hypothetical protein
MNDAFKGFLLAIMIFSALGSYWRSEYKMAMWMSFCAGAMLAGLLFNYFNTERSQLPRPEGAPNTVQQPSDGAPAGENPARSSTTGAAP